MQRPTVPIIGNSHTVPIQQGARRLAGSGVFRFVNLNNSKYTPRFERVGTETRLAGSIRNVVDHLMRGAADDGIITVGEVERTAPSPTRIFCVIGGNTHNLMALLKPARPFDFFEEAFSAPLDSGAEIVPFAAIRRTMSSGIRGQLDLLARIRAHSGVPAVHIQSPPPPRSNEWIKDNLGEKFRIGDDVEIASPSLRMKMYRLHSALFAEFCERKGIEIIRPPEEACDSDGYLLPEFAAPKNCTHANASYGELVSRQILARCH